MCGMLQHDASARPGGGIFDMAYTVKRGEKIHGHYETQAQAYDAIKNNLCRGEKPKLVHMSLDVVECYRDLFGNEIFLIPDSDIPS